MNELNYLSIVNLVCVGWAIYKRNLKRTIGFSTAIGGLDLFVFNMLLSHITLSMNADNPGYD